MMKKTFAAVIFIGIFAGGYVYFFQRTPEQPTYVVAARADIVREVSVTGRVQPAQTVNLTFEKTGRIVEVRGKVGDRVRAGALLARIDDSEILSQLSQAEASVRVAQARLEEFLRGARPEEIRVLEARIEGARAGLEDAQKNLADKILDAYTKSDDAVRNKIDRLFSNPRSPSPQLVFSVADSSLAAEIERSRRSIEVLLISWKDQIDRDPPIDNSDFHYPLALENLNAIGSFLERTAFAVNALTPSPFFPQTLIDSYKAEVVAARNAINAARASLLAADERIRRADSELLVAEEELIFKKAGFAVEQIAARRAELEQAQAHVKTISAQIAKTRLHAPFSGIITRHDAKTGEISSPQIPLVSLISDSELQIEAMVTENDIAEVKLQDAARVTLDAYGDDTVFSVRVVSVDPAAMVAEGVATYKVVLQFIENDPRVKSGMTANVDILVDERKEVIAVPNRAIFTSGGKSYVRVLKENVIREEEVVVGLRGSDGLTEIVAGIKEGDKVVMFLR